MQLILCGGHGQRRSSQRGTARERRGRQGLKASTHPLKPSMLQCEKSILYVYCVVYHCIILYYITLYHIILYSIIFYYYIIDNCQGVNFCFGMWLTSLSRFQCRSGDSPVSGYIADSSHPRWQLLEPCRESWVTCCNKGADVVDYRVKHKDPQSGP